ncbi:hypothetical protein LXL04_016620 [Taraxacum kok-saghyz]
MIQVAIICEFHHMVRVTSFPTKQPPPATATIVAGGGDLMLCDPCTRFLKNRSKKKKNEEPEIMIAVFENLRSLHSLSLSEYFSSSFSFYTESLSLLPANHEFHVDNATGGRWFFKYCPNVFQSRRFCDSYRLSCCGGAGADTTTPPPPPPPPPPLDDDPSPISDLPVIW